MKTTVKTITALASATDVKDIITIGISTNFLALLKEDLTVKEVLLEGDDMNVHAFTSNTQEGHEKVSNIVAACHDARETNVGVTIRIDTTHVIFR